MIGDPGRARTCDTRLRRPKANRRTLRVLEIRFTGTDHQNIEKSCVGVNRFLLLQIALYTLLSWLLFPFPMARYRMQIKAMNARWRRG